MLILFLSRIILAMHSASYSLRHAIQQQLRDIYVTEE
jgi:hypothetical protein